MSMRIHAHSCPCINHIYIHTYDIHLCIYIYTYVYNYTAREGGGGLRSGSLAALAVKGAFVGCGAGLGSAVEASGKLGFSAVSVCGLGSMVPGRGLLYFGSALSRQTLPRCAR